MQLIQQHHQEHQQQLGDGLTLRVVRRKGGGGQRLAHIMLLAVLAQKQSLCDCIRL
jgi:hypothetical protein